MFTDSSDAAICGAEGVVNAIQGIMTPRAGGVFVELASALGQAKVSGAGVAVVADQWHMPTLAGEIPRRQQADVTSAEITVIALVISIASGANAGRTLKQLTLAGHRVAFTASTGQAIVAEPRFIGACAIDTGDGITCVSADAIQIVLARLLAPGQ